MLKTLRSRVMISYLAVVLVSLILAGVVFIFFLSRYAVQREREEFGEEILAVSDQVGRVIEYVSRIEIYREETPLRLLGREVLLLRGILDASSRVVGAELVVCLENGRILAQTPGISLWRRIGRILVEPENVEKGQINVTEKVFAQGMGRYLVATVPVETRGRQKAFVIAVKPLKELGSPLGRLLLYLLAAGLISMGISMALGIYLSGMLSRPIRAVARAARRMASGDFDQRVEVAGFSESRELARDFNTMAERVKSAYERQRDFAANVSHEIRTPLTSIRGFAQSLLDGVSKTEEEKKRALEVIESESSRLERVLKDILLLSQIDAGELAVNRSVFDVGDLLRRMEIIYGGLAESKGIEMIVRTQKPSITVNTDPDRIERILGNLVDNAIKYTQKGGTVTLSVEKGDNGVAVSVNDTGPGIPEERMERIFDRFYRDEENRDKSLHGAGLGLAISKELAGTLNCRLKVKSTEGKGTQFTLIIPPEYVVSGKKPETV